MNAQLPLDVAETHRNAGQQPSTALTVTKSTEKSTEKSPNTEHVSHEDPDFWSRSCDVLFYLQPSTAAWINTRGGLVLRQENLDDTDTDDDWIIITKENAPAFVARLVQLVEAGE